MNVEGANVHPRPARGKWLLTGTVLNRASVWGVLSGDVLGEPLIYRGLMVFKDGSNFKCMLAISPQAHLLCGDLTSNGPNDNGEVSVNRR